VIVLGYLAYSSYEQSQGGNTGLSNLNGLVPGLGGGTPAGSGTDTGATAAPATTPLTNQAWVNSIASQVASTTGESIGQVELYLNEFTNGQQPVGVPGATTAFNNVVQAALSLGGQPPSQPAAPTPGLSPYGTVGQYLNDVLSYLPSGTSSSVQQEITSLLNGSTTKLSQDAANALASAQGVVGQGPIALVYSIIPAPATSAQVAALGASPYLSTTYTDPLAAFNAWATYARQYIPSLSTASQNDLLYLFNQTSQNPSLRNQASFLSFLNTSVIPQLGSLPTQTTVYQYNGSTILSTPYKAA
jgi:hypothetical protein